MIPMKTLTMDGKIHEIIDDKARNDIRRTRAPSIIQTVEGSVVAVNDAANDPLLGLKIFGKTTQDTTTVPAPDQPKELVSCGNDGTVNVEILGGNLFYPLSEWFAIGTNTTKYVSDDGYEIRVAGGTKGGYTSSSGFIRRATTVALRGKTLIFQADSIEATQPDAKYGPQITMHYEDGTAKYISLPSTDPVVVQVPNNAKDIQISIYTNNNAGAIETDNEVVVKGLRLTVADTEWSEYKPAKIFNISTPNGLPGIPVNQNGNYTDDSGQQWICDEIDFGRGRHVHRVKVIEFDGSEPWSVQEIPVENCLGIFLQKPEWGAPAGQFTLMCSHFKVALSGTNGKSVNTCAYNGGLENFLINVDTTVCGSTLTEIKQWMAAQRDAGTPVTAYIILANPYETALSDEAVEAFKGLYANYPSTTIYNDSGAWMEVTYNADTKTFIKNCIAEAMV